MTKISNLALIALVTSSCCSINVQGFTMNSHTSSRNSLRRFTTNVVRMSSTEDEVAALRAAAQKFKDEAMKLEKEMGKEITVEDETKNPVKTEMTVFDPEAVSKIDFTSGDVSEQVMSLSSLTESNKLGLWSAALTSSVNTNSPAPLRPYPVSLNFLEQRTGGKITGTSLGVGGEDDVSLDDFKYATLYVTGGSTIAAIASLALLPENVGAAFCYFFAIIPILFLGIGSSAPGIIAGAIASLRGTAEEQEVQEDRVCRHEAGHFLCGYLCGLPIKSYQTNDLGFPCVEFYPVTDGVGMGRELDEQEVCIMSVVAMSGSVAEVLKFGQAKGGDNDLLELDGLMRRSKDFIGAQKQQDLTRWGALTAYNIISSNTEKYEALVEAFRSKKSVNECITAIESCN